MGKKKKGNDKDGQIGLAKKRGCTDVLVLAAFVVFCISWASLASSAFKIGDPRKIWYPTVRFECSKKILLDA